MNHSDKKAIARAHRDTAVRTVKSHQCIEMTKAHIRQSGQAIERSLDLLKTTVVRDRSVSPAHLRWIVHR